MLGELGDLFLRTDCVCCGRIVDAYSTPSAGPLSRHVCLPCLQELSVPWQRWDPPTTVAPVFAAGAYGGPRRTLIISAKDRVRPAAIDLMGRMFYTGLQSIASRGLIHDPRSGPVALIPAPTRRASEKERGGDIVTRAATAARRLHATKYPEQGSNIGVFPVGRLGPAARDSVGLSREQRRANIARSIELDRKKLKVVEEFVHRGGSVVLVDDVCTTGATTAQYCLALASFGVEVSAILVIAGA